MELTVFIFEIIGTVAFAVSGAITALRKGMDIFGVMTLGLVTAVGGGVIRDIILGFTPPMMFREPVYALTAASVSVAVFILAALRKSVKNNRLLDMLLLIMDSLGLGVFTVIGIQTAYGVSADYRIFLLVFVGVVTGVGGGILRDIMADDTPYIFVKHVYALASIVGAIVCAVMWRHTGGTLAMICGASLIFVIRILAATFRWSLPRIKHPLD